MTYTIVDWKRQFMTHFVDCKRQKRRKDTQKYYTNKKSTPTNSFVGVEHFHTFPV